MKPRRTEAAAPLLLHRPIGATRRRPRIGVLLTTERSVLPLSAATDV